MISEQSTGFPGYNSIIAEDKATIGRILLDNGYATAWFGKDHNTPAFAASQVGPFDQWPTGMGFEYFYGFVGGDANQWQPNLFRNTTQIYPFEGKPGWNLITGMADDAIDYLNRSTRRSRASRSSSNTRRAPRMRRTTRRRNGWTRSTPCTSSTTATNKLRERIFENQKKLGVIPQDAKLTPWPDDVLKPGTSLPPTSRSSSSGRSRSSPPMPPTTTTRSAA